jgi:prepilin peptidase CpaA
MFLNFGRLGLGAGVVYTLLLMAASIGDIRSRRIPNRLVAVIAVLGLSWSIFVTPVLPGALRGVEGLLIGLACWLPFYVLGWLGAGDVKLFAAAAAWLGPLGALEGAFASAVCGAVLALIWMVLSYGGRNTATTLAMATSRPSLLASPTGTERKKTLPYGVALAVGASVAAWAPGFLL